MVQEGEAEAEEAAAGVEEVDGLGLQREDRGRGRSRVVGAERFDGQCPCRPGREVTDWVGRKVQVKVQVKQGGH